MVMSSRH